VDHIVKNRSPKRKNDYSNPRTKDAHSSFPRLLKKKKGNQKTGRRGEEGPQRPRVAEMEASGKNGKRETERKRSCTDKPKRGREVAWRKKDSRDHHPGEKLGQGSGCPPTTK